MDFEFNKRQCTPGQSPADPDCTSNGLTPIRSAGDLLIITTSSQGGVNPSCSVALGHVGSRLAMRGVQRDPVLGHQANLRSRRRHRLDQHLRDPGRRLGRARARTAPRTFGEAQIDLSAIFDPNVCESFGSAYLKSRSSDSFTAALKDFVPPAAVNIANCGSLSVTKYIDNDESGSFNTTTTAAWSPAT